MLLDLRTLEYVEIDYNKLEMELDYYEVSITKLTRFL